MNAAPFDATWLDRLPPRQLFGLDGKAAVITGAAGGIGRWLSAGLAAAGARVLLTDRVEGPLTVVSEALAAQGWSVATLVADLEAEDTPDRIVDAAVKHFGRLDILINNAGINQRIPMLDVPRELLEHIWRVDYIRQYELAQAAARAMLEHGGSIIHISSVNNAVGLEDVSLMGPTKAALSQLAKGMAIELAHRGIRTNAIAPGFMDTPINSTHWDDPTRAPWIFDRVPMARPGHPAELIGACLLLASDAGSFINGQTLYVDGGFTAGSRWNVPPGSGLQAFRDHGGYGLPVAPHQTPPE
jgi:NAD(P)-dependent dehydrogenase (short-subunit alcohol dehydrogenase family)